MARRDQGDPLPQSGRCCRKVVTNAVIVVDNDRIHVGGHRTAGLPASTSST